MPLAFPATPALLLCLALFLCGGSVAVAEEEPLPSFHLSAGFSSHMVMQRAPAKASIYGFGNGPVSVSVTGFDAAGAAVEYTVDGFTVDGASSAATSPSLPTWKAYLKPAAAGGNYTVMATGPSGAVVLEHVLCTLRRYRETKSSIALCCRLQSATAANMFS